MGKREAGCWVAGLENMGWLGGWVLDWQGKTYGLSIHAVLTTAATSIHDITVQRWFHTHVLRRRLEVLVSPSRSTTPTKRRYGYADGTDRIGTPGRCVNAVME
jgi:hypothetical protein